MKHRKFIKICAFLCVCIITGIISAHLIAKPINLTADEINYYSNVAEKIWYKGLSTIQEDDSIFIKFELANDKIHIFPNNTNKQSVTVDFSDSTPLITINEPGVSFWGCFLFYGTFFGSIIYGIICFCISASKGKLKKR